MDIVTLILAKKFASKVAAGFSNVVANDETSSIDFTLNDGTKTSLTFPKPKDGVSVEDIYLEGENVYCKFSNEEVKLVGPLPKQPFEISKDPGNGIDMHADGIFMSATGVDLSQEEGNILEAKDDGLYATAPELPDLNTDNITYGEEVLTDVIDDIEGKVFDVAPDWSEGTYSKGSYVTYNGKLYKKIDDVVEGLHWDNANQAYRYTSPAAIFWTSDQGAATKNNSEEAYITRVQGSHFSNNYTVVAVSRVSKAATYCSVGNGNTRDYVIERTLYGEKLYISYGPNCLYCGIDGPVTSGNPVQISWGGYQSDPEVIFSKAKEFLKNIGVYNPAEVIAPPPESEHWIEINYLTEDLPSFANKNDLSDKIDKNNPIGTGSLSLNRKADTEIGYNSIAIGYDPTATGTFSYAEGYETVASGFSSHAEGYKTSAEGYYAHAEGTETIASKYATHAEGYKTSAEDDYSHAEGYETVASGNGSHAEGHKTVASSLFAHSEGLETTASGNYSHAEGCETVAENACCHAEGNKTHATGSDSHAEGYDTVASGMESHAEGTTTIAYGDASHAEGSHTKANGTCSHAEGSKAEANGAGSHAEGIETKAYNSGSHAEGAYTSANADCAHSEGSETNAYGRWSHVEGKESKAYMPGAHAEGLKTNAYGSYSHVEGYGTESHGENQHVQGRFNIPDNTNTYAHIVGGGSYDEESEETTRKNIHTLDWDGNAWFNGTITAKDKDGNEVILGEGSSSPIAKEWDSNEVYPKDSYVIYNNTLYKKKDEESDKILDFDKAKPGYTYAKGSVIDILRTESNRYSFRSNGKALAYGDMVSHTTNVSTNSAVLVSLDSAVQLQHLYSGEVVETGGSVKTIEVFGKTFYCAAIQNCDHTMSYTVTYCKTGSTARRSYTLSQFLSNDEATRVNALKALLKNAGIWDGETTELPTPDKSTHWIAVDYLTDSISSKVDISEGQIEDTRVKKEMKIQQVGGGSIEFHNPKTSSIFEHICNEITNHSELISGNSEAIHDLLDPSFVPDYHTYSLNEQIVGEWIDNSPIYEKTFEIELTHGAGMYLYNIEIYNGNYEIVGIEGILKFPAGGANPLGWLNGDGATVSAFPTATNGVNINTFTVSRNGNKVQLTIKYLKKD